MEGNTALGASSPAKPAFTRPEPLSHTRAVVSSSSHMVSGFCKGQQGRGDTRRVSTAAALAREPSLPGDRRTPPAGNGAEPASGAAEGTRPELRSPGSGLRCPERERERGTGSSSRRRDHTEDFSTPGAPAQGPPRLLCLPAAYPRQEPGAGAHPLRASAASPRRLGPAIPARCARVRVRVRGQRHGRGRGLGAPSRKEWPIPDPLDIPGSEQRHLFACWPTQRIVAPDDLWGRFVGEVLPLGRLKQNL